MKAIRGNKTYELSIKEKPYIYDNSDIIFQDSKILAYIVYQGSNLTYGVYDKLSKENIKHFGLKAGLDVYLKKYLKGGTK